MGPVVSLPNRCGYCGESGETIIWHVAGCPRDTLGYVPESMRPSQRFRAAPVIRPARPPFRGRII